MKLCNLSWNRVIIMMFACSITMSREVNSYKMICFREDISHKTPNSFISSKTMNHQDHIFYTLAIPSFNVAKSEISNGYILQGETSP